MIEARSFNGKTVAVFGMGLSGLAVGRSLLAGGATVLAGDDSDKGREAARAGGLPLADLSSFDWTGIDALVLAPGVPLTHPKPHWTALLARANGVEIIGDTEIFERERARSGAGTKLVAITGTNGKSTTTALIHHLLRFAGLEAAVGGNIGKAVLDLPAFKDGGHYVLEFSSFQLDLTPSLSPDVAILLNISPDHLDRHGSMENYAAVKAQIVEHLAPNGTAIVGADDIFCDAIAARTDARGLRTLRISAGTVVQAGVYAEGTCLFEAKQGSILNSASLDGIGSLRGVHNAQNACAAIAAARTLGVAWGPLQSGLRSFPGLAHRLEEVRRIGNVLFINDSKATNADAAARALSTFSNIYWIAGGKPKEGGIYGLMRYLPRIKKAYFIGESAPAFAKTLEGALPFSVSGTLDEAVSSAAWDAMASTDSEAVVLLSPACASYDQFANFEERGRSFRSLVEALPEAPGKEQAA